MATPTCRMPCACSLAAIAISATRPSAAPTVRTISPSASPSRPQLVDPRRLLVMAASIFPAVSFAAAALRWASARTSSATTANPAPASPARAASTAALSARIFVWKAISSMSLTILATSALDTSMARIASFISPMVVAPDCAASRAWLANVLALSALSAVLRIMADICSRAALVSVTAEPCSLQPSASDWPAEASWFDASEVCAAPSSSASEIRPSDVRVEAMIQPPRSTPRASAAASPPPMRRKLVATMRRASAPCFSASRLL